MINPDEKVCEVVFTECTKDNHIRHLSFKGLRLDKKIQGVVREMPIRPQNNKAYKGLLSHPEKLLYPEDNMSKQEVFDYYQAVSDYIWPYLALRPLTIVRCPNQYQDCFYQRHIYEQVQGLKDVDAQYFYLQDKVGLLALVQMDVLEIHSWGSTINHLEKPDMLIFDLDPAPLLPWSQIVAGALDVKKYLAQYGLQSFVKTTGGKGLHIVVPIKPEYHWAAVKKFAHGFVQTLEKLQPKVYVSTMSKAKRKGKIFVDYLRNQRAATAICAYSSRARMHAPVATPLAWEELSTQKEDNSYTIKTIRKRLYHLKEDPWNDFWQIKQSLHLDEIKDD